MLLGAVLAYCRPAHAYIDSGTGSYILQVSIAAVAGALFSIKVFWASLRNRFRKNASNATSVANEAPRKEDN
jgi:hypothetical protein